MESLLKKVNFSRVTSNINNKDNTFLIHSYFSILNLINYITYIIYISLSVDLCNSLQENATTNDMTR